MTINTLKEKKSTGKHIYIYNQIYTASYICMSCVVVSGFSVYIHPSCFEGFHFVLRAYLVELLQLNLDLYNGRSILTKMI